MADVNPTSRFLAAAHGGNLAAVKRAVASRAVSVDAQDRADGADALVRKW